MPITVFRARVNPETKADYLEAGKRMVELAPTMPGYISHKKFVAEDGEQVTIVEFEDDDSQLAWAQHPEHRAAMKLGRDLWFDAFDIAICRIERRYLKP